MSFIANIHDAMREMRVVPDREDVPFVACSTEWRANLLSALSRVDNGEARIDELESEVSHLEDQLEAAESAKEDLEDEVSELEDDVISLKREIEQLKRLSMGPVAAQESATL